MRVVIPGGTGHVGQVLRAAWEDAGHDVVVLSRRPATAGRLTWDGCTLGDWAAAIDGADVVVNLAGRTVDCRYTEENLRQMMSSRVLSTRVIGEAIAAARRPPSVWLQMSTATIYAHRTDAPNDEAAGLIGGDEPDVPAYWARSIDIAKAWEQTLAEAVTPRTRKVALRTAMVMSPVKGSVFDVLSGMVRWGLGGPIGGGDQRVSWIHEADFVAALEFLISRDDLEGAVNLAAPGPVVQRVFMEELRAVWGVGVGLPATRWMAEVGAWVMRTDTELVLKSRYVVPGRLLEAGFTFEYPTWPLAAEALVEARKAR